MSIRTMVFDIDGTLAPLSRPIKQDIVQGLLMLEERGYRVGFASGKPCQYIEGFARAIGLKRFFAIGENGAVYLETYNGHTIPLAKRLPEFDELQMQMTEKYPDVFFQNNIVNISIFCEDMSRLKLMMDDLREEGWAQRQDVTVYFHPDCVDIVPSGVDKGTGIAFLKQRYEWDTTQVLAVGDSINDEAMKREAGLFYAVGDGIEASMRFKNRQDMMQFLLKNYSGF